MKKIAYGVFAGALMLAGLAIAAEDKNAGAVLGKWQSDDGPHQAYFEIYKAGDKYEGKIIGLKEEKFEKGDPEEGVLKHDRHNPEKSLQARPIIGIVFLKDFDYDGDGKYTGGTIYDPESGKTYKCKMTLKGDTLDVRGYVGVSMFGRTETWTRYNEKK